MASGNALFFFLQVVVMCFTTGISKQPNVIIFITDDQGYGDVAAHGNSEIITPNMDRLYRESVRLTNFHVDPTCSPTRAALLTGRYSHRTGVWHTITARHFLRRDEITMADVFRANGYVTGIFGKWHLGENYPYRPIDRGFDAALIHRGGAIGQTLDYWGNEYFDPICVRNDVPEKQSGFCTDIWIREAISFIEANQNNPFFVVVATNAAHRPFVAKKKDMQRYSQFGNLYLNLKKFYALLTSVDDGLGFLDSHLEDLNLKEDTIFIFTSDNGSAGQGFNAGLKGYKSSEFDGGHRVPMYIRWPRFLQGGWDSDQLSAHIDILPTLMDWCDLRYNSAGKNLDGVNLASIFQGNHISRIMVVESQRIDQPQKWKQTAVMMTDADKNDWRLVNGEKLYNMLKDRSQTRNLYDNFEDIVSQMKLFYNTWWREVSEKDNIESPISIGGPQKVVALNAHDWQGGLNSGEIPWEQRDIENPRCINGYWPIYVEKSDKYEFQVYRWPKELNRPLREKTSIAYNKAELILNGITYRANVVSDDEKYVSFNIHLDKGNVQLEALFTNGKEGTNAYQSCGAYYVYVMEATPSPTESPTQEPTNFPTPQPTRFPTPQPTQFPTPQPSQFPTPQPTQFPTPQPSQFPTPQPTQFPSPQPTHFPTPQPTQYPTSQPTKFPSPQPTHFPTPKPTQFPSPQPTESPTPKPTQFPSPQPTAFPTPNPTKSPTPEPTAFPTPNPTTISPTPEPTGFPTPLPTTKQPTIQPTKHSTPSPTTKAPTNFPSSEPTASPTTCLFYDQDFAGSDVAQFEQVTSVELCQALCQVEPKCTYFTWFSPSVQWKGGRRKCFLKNANAIDNRRSRAFVISGPKHCNSSPPSNFKIDPTMQPSALPMQPSNMPTKPNPSTPSSIDETPTLFPTGSRSSNNFTDVEADGSGGTLQNLKDVVQNVNPVSYIIPMLIMTVAGTILVIVRRNQDHRLRLLIEKSCQCELLN